MTFVFFFSSRRRHTRYIGDWSSDVCSSDLATPAVEAFPHYFVFGYPPPGETFHRGVRQLPPAHWMTVDGDGKIVCRRYWDLTVRGTEGPGPSEREAVGAVRTLVTEAVRKRLVSDVPLGA